LHGTERTALTRRRLAEEEEEEVVVVVVARRLSRDPQRPPNLEGGKQAKIETEKKEKLIVAAEESYLKSPLRLCCPWAGP
jgi:hypothetical protein